MARNRWTFMVALMMVLALVAAACSSDDDDASSDTTAASSDEATTTAAADDAAEEFKIAFVYVGPSADKGWSWAHDQGAKYLEANMPGVEITTLENITEGPDSQRVFEDLAADGNTLIFGTSFGYMDPMLAAAENYPDVTFMHATGYKTSDNMGNYFGAADSPRLDRPSSTSSSAREVTRLMTAPASDQSVLAVAAMESVKRRYRVIGVLRVLLESGPSNSVGELLNIHV